MQKNVLLWLTHVIYFILWCFAKHISEKRIQIGHFPRYFISYVEEQKLKYPRWLCVFVYCTLKKVLHSFLYIYFLLFFSEPRTEIVGKKELYVDYASSLNITCLIKSPNPPAYVFWKKEGKVSKKYSFSLLILINSILTVSQVVFAKKL